MPINFLYSVSHDLERFAQNQLANLGLKSDPAKSPLLQLAEWNRRQISHKSREVLESSHIQVSEDVRQGYENLKASIKNGDNINPYLSSNLNNASFTDGFFNEFGLYHFHLGVGLITHGKSKNFIQRTKEIALAKVTDNSVIFILIEDHNHATNPDIWYDQQCIQILHDEFPYIIEANKVKSMVIHNPITTNEMRKKLRNISTNVAVTLNDGTSYILLGGGMVASGQNASAVRTSFDMQRDIKLLIDSLRPQLLETIKHVHKVGAIELKLIHATTTHKFFHIFINGEKHILSIDQDSWSFRLFFTKPYISFNQSLPFKLISTLETSV